MIQAIRKHWPEYLMEAISVAIFLFVAGMGATLLRHVDSPIYPYVSGAPMLQRLLLGLVVGLTAVSIVYSPVGKRSGAHINPAVTLTFLRLGKISPWDALFYVIAQFTGAILGMNIAWFLLGDWVSAPAVNYAVTVPGTAGYAVAFFAEAGISLGVMSIVLWSTNRHHLHKYTGIMVGIAIATYITLESPLSGTSMNPARTLGSAVPAHVFTGIWIYFLAPLVGMFLAAEIYLWKYGADAVHCAKLYHSHDVRCIFKCGYAMKMNEMKLNDTPEEE